MRLPKLTLPGRGRLRLPDVRAIGPGSVSSLLKIALDVAFWMLALITGVLVFVFVFCIFVPLENLNVTVSDRALPLTRPLLLFGVGAFAAYFGGFMLIVRNLRMIFRTLTVGDPFHPSNVSRLQHIGVILAVVTGGVWAAQGLVATRVADGVLESQGLGDLLTPGFSVMIVLVLAEVFREGARLRREAELTI